MGHRATFTTPNGQTITVDTVIPRHDPKKVHVEFVNQTAKQQGKDPTGITKTGEAAIILTTVHHALQDYIKRHDFERVNFSAREPSRRRLYNRLLDRLATNDWYIEDNKGSFELIRKDTIPVAPPSEKKGLMQKLMPWRY